MGLVIIEIAVIFIMLLINGLFAMSELAVISARKIRLQQWASEGNRRAQQALALANSPARFLSTVQVGITLVGILSGAFGGATLAEHLEAYFLAHFPAYTGYASVISVIVVVAAITYLNILIGELVPKRVALRSPERVAMAVAGLMNNLSRIASPFVNLLTASTEFIVKFLGLSADRMDEAVTQEDIMTLVEQGTQAGVFEKSEQDIVEKVLAFGDKRVSSIMTPRPDIRWIDLEDDFSTALEMIRESPHSFFPVTRGGLDNLLGTLHVKDLYFKELKTAKDIESVLYQPIYIPETNSSMSVLESFRETGTHLGFVIDEYGAIQGIVTLNDILTAIVGDIPSRYHPEDLDIQQRDDGSWLLDGMTPIEEFKSRFEFDELPDEQRANFQTIAGFVMSYLGRVPSVTDSFEWGGYRFEVIDMDANRIDKILLTQVQIAAEAKPQTAP